MRRFVLCATLAMVLVTSLPRAEAALPDTVHFQGSLTTQSGAPVEGTFNLDISLHDAKDGGALLWSKLFTAVPVASGVFELELGPFPASVTGGATEVWVQTKVGTEPPLERVRLLAVPYAVRAQSAVHADDAGGLTCTDCVTGVELDSSVVTGDHVVDGSLTDADINFKYAAGDAKNGAATKVECNGCVKPIAVSFNYADSAFQGGPASGLACSGPCVEGGEIAASAITGGHIADGSVKDADVGFDYAAGAGKGGAATGLACTSACVSLGEVDSSVTGAFVKKAGDTVPGTVTFDGGGGPSVLYSKAEGAGKLRVGAVWSMPGLYSGDDGANDLVLGAPAGRRVKIGTSPNFVEVDDEGNLWLPKGAKVHLTEPAPMAWAEATANDHVDNSTVNPTYVDLPGMSANLTTEASPVLALFKTGGTQGMGGNDRGRFELLFDGVQKAYTLHEFHNNSWELRDVSLMAIEPVTAGAHNVKVRWNTEISYVGTGWYSDTRTIDLVELRNDDGPLPYWKATGTNQVSTTSTGYVDVPGMAVNVTTTGNPVWIGFKTGGTQITGVANGRARFRVTVDGAQKTYTLHEFHNNGWELRDVSLYWLEALPAGNHDIRVQWNTEGGTLTTCWYADTRSLDVIELKGSNGPMGAWQANAANSVATGSTSYVNLPDMTLSITTGASPVLFVFKTGGTQITGVANGRARFRLLVDGQEKAFTLHEFHNNGWELRDVSLFKIETLSAGNHTVQVQWNTESANLGTGWYSDNRVLQAIELRR